MNPPNREKSLTGSQVKQTLENTRVLQHDGLRENEEKGKGKGRVHFPHMASRRQQMISNNQTKFSTRTLTESTNCAADMRIKV